MRPDPFEPGVTASPVKTWVFTLKTYFLASGVPATSHEQRIWYAATPLRGTAVEWWRQLCSMPSATDQQGRLAGAASYFGGTWGVTSRPTTWDEFVQALIARFGFVEPSEQARRGLSGLRQAGSAQSYTREFLALANQIDDLSPAEAKYRYYEGLKKFLQREVDRARCLDLHDMIQVAERLDSPPDQSYPRRGNQYNRGGNSGRAAGGTTDAPVEVNGFDAQSRDTRKCFNCNELGHIARNCKKPKKQSKSGNGTSQ